MTKERMFEAVVKGYGGNAEKRGLFTDLNESKEVVVEESYYVDVPIRWVCFGEDMTVWTCYIDQGGSRKLGNVFERPVGEIREP